MDGTESGAAGTGGRHSRAGHDSGGDPCDGRRPQIIRKRATKKKTTSHIPEKGIILARMGVPPLVSYGGHTSPERFFAGWN